MVKYTKNTKWKKFHAHKFMKTTDKNKNNIQILAPIKKKKKFLQVGGMMRHQFLAVLKIRKKLWKEKCLKRNAFACPHDRQFSCVCTHTRMHYWNQWIIKLFVYTGLYTIKVIGMCCCVSAHTASLTHTWLTRWEWWSFL